MIITPQIKNKHTQWYFWGHCLVSSKKAPYCCLPPVATFFQSQHFFIHWQTFYWYLGLLDSHKWTLSSVNFCLCFSPSVSVKPFWLISPFLDLNLSCYMWPCKPACPPFRQEDHPIVMIEQFVYQRKNMATYSIKTNRRVILFMSYLKSRSNSYDIRWECGCILPGAFETYPHPQSICKSITPCS